MCPPPGPAGPSDTASRSGSGSLTVLLLLLFFSAPSATAAPSGIIAFLKSSPNWSLLSTALDTLLSPDVTGFINNGNNGE